MSARLFMCAHALSRFPERPFTARSSTSSVAVSRTTLRWYAGAPRRGRSAVAIWYCVHQRRCSCARVGIALVDRSAQTAISRATPRMAGNSLVGRSVSSAWSSRQRARQCEKLACCWRRAALRHMPVAVDTAAKTVSGHRSFTLATIDGPCTMMMPTTQTSGDWQLAQ